MIIWTGKPTDVIEFGTPDSIVAAKIIAAAIDRFTLMVGTKMDALIAQVTATVGVQASAVTLIQGLVAELVAAQGDPAKVQALTDQLKASTDALAAAVAANQPPATP